MAMELPGRRRTRYTHSVDGGTHRFEAEGLRVSVDPSERTLTIERHWSASGKKYSQSETLHYGSGPGPGGEANEADGRMPGKLPLDHYHLAAMYMMLEELPEEHRDAIRKALSQYVPGKWKGIRRTVREIGRS